VPNLLVPDNTKVAVIKACLYEPQVNRTYAEMAIIERWLLGKLRHRRFYSLADLNAAIGELLYQLNEERPIRRLGVTRRALLEELDRPHLKAFPGEPYAFAEWRLRRVGVDYHVEVEAHLYSVPTASPAARSRCGCRRAPSRSSSRASGSPRICAPAAITGTPPCPHTCRRAPAAMPTGRSGAFARRPPRSPATFALCEKIPEHRPHPEQGFRSCLGIVRLVRPFGADRVEAAATRAIEIGTRLGALDPRQQARSPSCAIAAVDAVPVLHSNIGGPRYYH
jgi:hypothetical protein